MHKRILAVVSGAVIALGLIALPGTAEASGVAASGAGSRATTGSVAVQLVTPWGTPLALKGIYVGVGATTVVTDARGVAVFSKLRAGNVTVVPHAPHGSAYVFPSTRSVKVVAGKKASVKLTGAVGAAISGTVSADSSAGRLVDNAVVAAIPVGKTPGGAGVYAETARDGKYTLQGLANGTYKVLFEPPAAAPALKNYIYNYWKGAANYASAQTITVRSQTATTPPISARNFNDVLVVGKRLTVSMNASVLTTVGHDFTAIIAGTHGTSDVDSVSVTPPTDTTEFSTKLVPGKFTLSFVGRTANWWYTGQGLPLSRDASKAAVITFDATADESVNIGAFE
ncbi:hypothetical protein [Glaciihabitans sp. dw_435]|uniref:hypothetical protein n=1 Tax=Glaciihabitans sp. dw_435 TaxID=2720081 RepID=UPI001BD3F35E|nr:hypothetical protein [Glaciihabitans sp. dw_435]